jgi:hypothetical protein
MCSKWPNRYGKQSGKMRRTVTRCRSPHFLISAARRKAIGESCPSHPYEDSVEMSFVADSTNSIDRSMD